MHGSPIRLTVTTEFPENPRPLIGTLRICLTDGCTGKQVYGERPTPGWRCPSCGAFETE